MTLSASPASVGVARNEVAAACRASGLDGLAQTGALLVSELVTNAIVHVEGDLTLSVACIESQLLVSVSDGSSDPPIVNHSPATDQPGGRGLYLVDALADSWNYEPTPSGKTVWFALDETRTVSAFS